MESSPAAIKYIDPYWDYVQIGLYLYPSLFYALGIADNHNQPARVEKFPDKIPSEDDIEAVKTDDEDIRDKISGGPVPISFINFWSLEQILTFKLSD